MAKIDYDAVAAPYARHRGASDLVLAELRDAAPYRDKAYSCLHLIAEEAFLRGLRRLEDDLAAGPVTGWSGYVALWGKAP